ncbi:Fanconi anemia group D2 protein-like [Antedon mediterranea]|uniref:Fanconi anemia group D2 protein-like n=1 Tax=Antedon mediterranea TaxID=105859 RepID=UPI003AF51977
MELVKKNCYSMPQVTALFYDELATIILKRQLNAKVQSWIDEEIANEFQDKYVTDIDVESVAQASEGFVSSGLFYSLEHEGSVAGIAIDIVKLTDSMVVPAAKSADLESPVCAVCLNPLFRLLKSCEEVRNGNLDDIDALLGCPVKTINIDNLQKPDKYSVKERKHICAYIFNTINWFREMLNAFSSHPDPELRLKVIERLENIIRLQDVLQSFLKFSPELKPPASEKNLEFLSTVKEVCIKVKAKPLSFQKQQKSNSQLKKDSSVTQCDESISQREEEKKTSKNMLTTNLLDHFKVYYRDLDITVFSVFSWAPISNSFGENSKEAKQDDALEAKVSAEQVAFLLNDLYYKVNESLKPKQKLINLSKVKQKLINLSKVKQKLINLSKNLHNQNSHTHIPFVSENCMVDRVLDLTSVLCLHLENASAFYQALASDEEDLDDSYLPSSNSDHMEACYSLVLQVLIAVTSWSGFSNDANEELLESFFVHIYNRVHTTSEVKVTREQLLRESFVYLENFSNSVPNLNCAVLLVKLLISIENKANLADLRTKLGNLGKKFLQKKWSIVDCEMMSKRSELIQQLLRTYVTYSDDRFDCLSTITSTGMTELIESEGRQASQTYPLLTKQSFGCFFRNILCELVQGVKQISSTKDGTNDNAVCQWNAAIKVLQMLTKLIKMFTAKSNISALLKQGQKFIDVFLRSGMPILDKMFRLKKDDVLNMLKTLQHSTRMLHHICSHSKSVGDIALVAHVPPMKRSLESFVYRVKVMLTLHNCQDAFWIGNLKNRNIQGTEILSQRPASPSESESVDCGANSGDEEKSNSDDDNVDKTDDDESSKEDNKSDELICSDTEY